MQITKIVLFFLFGATMASSQVQITGSQMILGTATSNACPISPCSIATGGTGATTASQALTNLGALPEAGGDNIWTTRHWFRVLRPRGEWRSLDHS